MRLPAQNLPTPCAGSIAKTAHVRSRIAIWRGLACWIEPCDQRRRGPPLRLPGTIAVNRPAVSVEIDQRCHEMETDLQRRRFTADEYYRMAEARWGCSRTGPAFMAVEMPMTLRQD
jgi:hypothetical protein